MSSSVRLSLVLLVAIALVGGFSAPGAAQGPPPVFELPDVVAPGRRVQRRASTPASVSILTADELARLGVRTVGDALRFVPEVSVRGFGGLGATQEVSIRGTATAHVLVLIDGVPLNSPAQGLAQLNTLPVDNIERIEVLRGPFSAIYGSGALGGVVNIVTRTRGQTAKARGGSQGSTAAGALWEWQIDRARLTVDAIHDSTGGFRRNSDYSGQTFAGRLRLAAADQRTFTLGVNRYQADQGVPGDTAFPSPLARQQTGRTIVDATWRSLGGVGSSSLFRAYWVNESISFANPAFAFTSRSDTQNLGLEGQLVLQAGPSRVMTLGLEAQRQSIDSLSASPFGTTAIRRDAWIGAAYALSDMTLSPKTLLSVGLRYDTHSVYGGDLNPRVGILHRADDQTILRFAVGRTFRGPTFLLLFFPGCSNPDLRPERAWSADAGIERTISPTLVARVTVFATQASDLITSGCPPMNVSAASFVGGSAELEGQLSPRLQVRAHVSFTSARDQAGAPLIRVPQVVAGAALHYSVNAASTLSLLVNQVGSRPDLDFSTFPATSVTLPPYILIGLRYTLRAGPGTWQLGVDNLFEAAYEAIKGFPSPGRSIFISYGLGF